MIYAHGWPLWRHTPDIGRVTLIQRPSSEQITLAQAYDQLDITPYVGSPPTHPDDAWIERNVSAARQWCEWYSGFAFATQIRELSLTRFPTDFGRGFYFHTYCTPWSRVKLPGLPIAGIESIRVKGDDGQYSALDETAFEVDLAEGAVYPASGSAWPTVAGRPAAVLIRYACGYALDGESPTPDDRLVLPETARSAMLLVLRHLYDNKGDSTELKLEQIPLGAAALLDSLGSYTFGIA